MRRQIAATLVVASVVLCFVARVASAAPGDFLQTFVNPSPSSGMGFGVFVNPVGNDKVLVGAYGGAAYLYSATSGALLNTLSPSGGGSRFGISGVAVGGGSNVVVGDDMAGNGVAYLMDSSVPGGIPPLATYEPPTPQTTAENMSYGRNPMAISGGTLWIGAYLADRNPPLTNSGAVYAYNLSTGSCTRTFTPSVPAIDDQFGHSVQVSGSNLLVGAPRTTGTGSGYAEVFNLDGIVERRFTNPTPSVGDWFGYSVAIKGNIALIGAPNPAGPGSVFMFDINSGDLLHTINNPTPAVNDYFGEFVTFVGDNVLIGAMRDSDDGLTSGAAWLFDGTGNLLHRYANPHPENGDQFGNSVAAMGDNVLVGCSAGPGHGAAYLFEGVPEPSTFVLLGVGAVSLLAYGWQRRRAG
jgi:hypothetical protein